MNIYLISQGVDNGCDTYDSAVVIAPDEESARRIHPSPYVTHVSNNTWMGTDCDGTEYNEEVWGTWVDYAFVDQVKVKLVGKACEGAVAGVVLASFNAC
jgi:hypothetical protein